MNTKNRIKVMLNFGVLAIMLLAVTATSFGAQLAIFGEDFEDPQVVGYDKQPPIPAGWVRASEGFGSDRMGLYNDGAGNQSISFQYTNSGMTTAEGVIGTLEEGVTYTVSFDAAMDTNKNNGLPYSVQLVTFAIVDPPIARNDVRGSFTNLTILASTSGNAPEDGSWASNSFDFTVDPEVAAHAAAIGQDIAVRLLGATTSALIDNVVVSVPGVDPNLPSVDAGSDWVTWSGMPVVLDDVSVIDNTGGAVTLTYAWSADPADGVEFSATDVESPVITITKPEGDPVTVTFTLACNYVGSNSEDIIDTMTIDVFDDACAAAAGGGTVSFDATDFNTDCITDVLDLAQIAMNWLNDYTITESVVK